MMVWIYLSPHLDDVALSAGGLVWEQTQSGQKVQIWTLCAGDPPPGGLSPFAQSLHDRWGTGRDSVAFRRQEDQRSCDLLGASYHHFDIPDCIYRRSIRTGAHLYPDEDDLWAPIHPDEGILLDEMGQQLRKKMTPLLPDVRLVSPLALGDHVDHRLTRALAEQIGLPLLYYADYPYVVRMDSLGWASGMKSEYYQVSPQGMQAWQKAISAHASQISTFWGGLGQMRTELESYYQEMGGIWIGSETAA